MCLRLQNEKVNVISYCWKLFDLSHNIFIVHQTGAFPFFFATSKNGA